MHGVGHKVNARLVQSVREHRPTKDDDGQGNDCGIKSENEAIEGQGRESKKHKGLESSTQSKVCGNFGGKSIEGHNAQQVEGGKSKTGKVYGDNDGAESDGIDTKADDGQARRYHDRACTRKRAAKNSAGGVNGQVRFRALLASGIQRLRAVSHGQARACRLEQMPSVS